MSEQNISFSNSNKENHFFTEQTIKIHPKWFIVQDLEKTVENPHLKESKVWNF